MTLCCLRSHVKWRHISVACHSLQNVPLATTVTGVARRVATVWRRARVVMTRGSVRPDVRRDSPEVCVCKVRCLRNLELYSYLFLFFLTRHKNKADLHDSRELNRLQEPSLCMPVGTRQRMEIRQGHNPLNKGHKYQPSLDRSICRTLFAFTILTTLTLF